MAIRPRKYGDKKPEFTNTLVVDGNALFKRGFIGASDVWNMDGNHIGGLYQFITILRKLLMENLYHKVFVFWDGKYSGKMRWRIYPDYKSSRNKDYINGTKPIDEDEIKEKFQIRQYLEELCIRQHMDESDIGVEGDDLIAQYCLTKEEFEKITICTSDRDLCQLINEDVKIYLCDKKEYVSADNYNDYFKHHQSNSKLIKIIAGDNSDSIKGISGVMETTLLKLFPQLTERAMSLEEIINSAKEQQEERIKKKLKPLKALTNIIERNTDGIQGKQIYSINEQLVDLSKPLLDEKNKLAIDELKGPIGDMDDRGIKNVFKLMKRDRFNDAMSGPFNLEYLMPFKELIEREKKIIKILNE